MRNGIFILLFIIVFFNIGCNSNSLDKNGNPATLIIGVYSGDNPSQTKEHIIPFQHYLEKEIGTKVSFIFTTDYTTLIESIQRKKIHVAQLSPFAYVLATRKPGLTPLVTIGINGQNSSYHSIIFSNPASGIKSLEDVKKRARNLTLCFADPASASGHLIPRAYLKSIGLDPDTAFKQTIFAGSHAASILSVKSGRIDIGCSTNDLVLDILIREGSVKKEDLTILWISDPIINDAITVRNDLNTDLIKKIKAAYLNAALKDSTAFKGAVFRYYRNPKNMQFIEVADSSYNSIRKVAEGIKELKLIK